MQSAIELVTYFFLQWNWVDWIIILAVIFYMIEGYAVGALSGIFDIINFLLSFAAGLRFYKPVGMLVNAVTHFPLGVSHILAFVFLASMIEMLLRFLQGRLTERVRKRSWLSKSLIVKLNRILGVIPGFFSGLVLLAFLLTVMIILPVSSSIKQAISTSKFGNTLVSQAQNFEQNLASLFGQKSDDLLTFFTVEPDTNGTIVLDFKTVNGTFDESAEQHMVDMVNGERRKQHLPDVTMSEKLRDIARSHSQDMLERGYFSHYTPEGKSPFDRMVADGIMYTFAGENLAFSANVDLAMQGLMRSKGHRENILSPNFKKIGIGVINAGVYGEMFSQEFTD